MPIARCSSASKPCAAPPARRWAWATSPTASFPKPVIASDGDDEDSVTSRYFTPRRCHASHAVTGAIGVATAFALPGTVISGATGRSARASSRCCIRKAASTSRWRSRASATDARVQRAALVRTARKILQGELHLPPYVFSKPTEGDKPMKRLIAPPSPPRWLPPPRPPWPIPTRPSPSSCRPRPAAATTRWRAPSPRSSARCSARR